MRGNSTTASVKRVENQTLLKSAPFLEEQIEFTNPMDVGWSDTIGQIRKRFQNSTEPYNPFSTVIDPKIREQLRMALKNATDEINILIWYPPFGKRLDRRVQSNECGNCKITQNRSLIDEPNTKAVLFHYRELDVSTMPNPSTRRNDQYNIFWTMESTVSIRGYHSNYEAFDDVFNLTMSHRRDSDIFNPYGIGASFTSFLEKPDKENSVVDKIIQSKTKLAVWVVSNCAAKKRISYVNALVSYGLAIDRKGRCYEPNVDRSAFQIESIKQYKFYFAFENSYHCRDYITEKFYINSIRQGAVPVVYGATKEDYTAFAPPNSFIFAEEYSPQLLVEYLQYLDQNETAYRQYFAWRTKPIKWFPNLRYAIGFCQLCRTLHGINVDSLRFNETNEDIPLFGLPRQPRTVKSLKSWLYGNDKFCEKN
uniref:alpha-(1,3)-fucosyltransferase 6-like n=1 Tax=Ciona intestinalis TaxID=7719 RepID=UPI000EF5262E|nr:alpha-(1,3)-fucosyltransferase 6-like [Ciona intestinalis]|eukprot:XP_018669388.2 alpha-(1,3)-fucosyltransferase 6-like [Ciona intestinalis]